MLVVYSYMYNSYEKIFAYAFSQAISQDYASTKAVSSSIVCGEG